MQKINTVNLKVLLLSAFSVSFVMPAHADEAIAYRGYNIVSQAKSGSMTQTYVITSNPAMAIVFNNTGSKADAAHRIARGTLNCHRLTDKEADSLNPAPTADPEVLEIERKLQQDDQLPGHDYHNVSLLRSQLGTLDSIAQNLAMDVKNAQDEYDQINRYLEKLKAMQKRDIEVERKLADASNNLERAKTESEKAKRNADDARVNLTKLTDNEQNLQMQLEQAKARAGEREQAQARVNPKLAQEKADLAQARKQFLIAVINYKQMHGANINGYFCQ